MTRDYNDGNSVEPSSLPEPDHHTVKESFRYGLGNGSKKLLLTFFASMAVMAVLIVLLALNLVREVGNEDVPPYNVRLPSVVLERGDDGQAVARDGVVRLQTERCNTTSTPIVLNITGNFIRPADGLIAGDESLTRRGITVPTGGYLCDGGDPIISAHDLPDEAEDGDVWQMQSQIVVSECLAWDLDPNTGRDRCTEVGGEIDQIGWFSEPFEVEAGQ